MHMYTKFKKKKERLLQLKAINMLIAFARYLQTY